jgi:hypothetical protein
LSVTVTTTGRPVRLVLRPASTISTATSLNNDLYLQSRAGASGGGSVGGVVRFRRDSTTLFETLMMVQGSGASGTTVLATFPTSALTFLDHPSSGTYTYTVSAKLGISASDSVALNNLYLMGYEI